MINIFSSIDADNKLLSKLNSLEIFTYWDILRHIPTRYEDLTQIYKICDVKIGMQVQVEGEIISATVIPSRNKQLHVKIADDQDVLTLIFFNFYPNYSTQYKIGKKIRAFGEIKKDFTNQRVIIHPKIQTITHEETELPSSFSPIYGSTKGLTQKQILKIVDQAFTGSIPETLTNAIIKKYNLLKLSEALKILHKLTETEFKNNYHQIALKRLKFDELLAQQLILRRAYQYKHTLPAISLKPKATYTKKLLDNLSFSLTNAQTRVLAEIYMDIAKPQQMNRLLQGDVGSGKTIVATLAMLVAVENDYQAALIAPTEILAEQHYQKTLKLLEPLGINVVWLSGSQTQKSKKDAYSKVQNGAAKVIIGTHAVFQKDVEFYNLALVVIDEQHRFGVRQRLALQDKGNNPHQLMMSATPIPRTLAMSYYADLDLSIIDELPKGRTPIKTLLINNNRRQEVIQFIKEQALTAQIYWVCPLIDESEVLELETATNTFNELTELLAPLEVGLIHGKLKSAEKTNTMSLFSQNKIKVLVATTVIEVGVDVPNASIMIIEHSERMGLSQLHQLRGRVGRGSVESQCILLYQNPLSDIAKRRLKAIYENTDGFKIAHADLLIRGPGEILGSRQSGLPNFKFVNIEEDMDLLSQAKTLANEMLRQNSELVDLHLKLWFDRQEHFIKA